MFSSTKGRLIASLVAALLFFAAGSGASMLALFAETSRFETLSRDAAATASERLPLLTTVERIQRNIGEVRTGVMESIAQHHAMEIAPGPNVGDARADQFWADTEIARQHAANLGLDEVIEGIDALEMIFPLFYGAGREIAQAYDDGRRDELDNAIMLGFSTLGSILDRSVDDLPRMVEQVTQERLRANDLRAVSLNRSNTILLRIIIATTVVGGALALVASLYLFRLLSSQYQFLKIERDRAEIATRARTEFLVNMSHELRTPLNAIIGFSEIMEKEMLGPIGSTSYRGYAGDIRESGQHLLSLINDILDLSKIDSGETELYEEVIDIATAIRATLTLLGPRAEQKGIKLELDIADPLPALFADERKLKQVLVNLLANAVKFTDRGGTVTFKVRCPAGNGHVFQIVDTGIGIAAGDIAKALRLFGQVDGKISRQYEGTGLGLPLSAGLVQLHGGRLELESEVDVGTTVTIRLPAARVVGGRDNAVFPHLEKQVAS